MSGHTPERQETLTLTGKPGFSRRLRACLKACHDIPTEALEQGIIADLLATLEQIRDKESMEPSEYIATYGEPSMTLGELAGAAVDRVNAEEG